MVLVEFLTHCSYKTLTAKFVQVVKIRLFTVVSNSYAKITFLPKHPLLTYVGTHQNKHDYLVRKLNYFIEKQNSKKNCMWNYYIGKKEFKYTTEAKTFKYFIGKKVFQHLNWQSSPFNAIIYCNCEAINLH
jgi:hypothetical protein